MNVATARDIWRTTHVMDTVAPYLWSDDEFLEFFNDAQIEAARRAHLLVDSSSDITQISISAGDKLVDIDPRVIFLRRIRLASKSVALVRKSVRDMDEAVPGWENATPSSPVVFIPDYQSDAVALWPPSNIDDTLTMTVVREPLTEMAGDDDTPEIPARQHRSLLYWVDFRAYSKPDADALNPGAARLAESKFEQEFGAKSSAIDEHWNREQNFDNGDFQ